MSESENTNYELIAQKVFSEVGGSKNISKVSHCATRLRLNLKNLDVLDTNKIKKINGVLGVVKAGGQLQVVIGPNVSKVFIVFNKINSKADLTLSNSNDYVSDLKENSENKYNVFLSFFKKIGNGILDGLSGSLVPAIPVITASAFFRIITSIFGPSMLNIMSSRSDLYVLLNFVGDAGFYFFPVIIGYTAAKKFNVLPVLGILLGAIMIHPTLIGLVGKNFNVYGIPTNVQNYSSTILPIIMSVYVMSFVEKFLNKYLPTVFRSVFAPALTIAVMLPITLTVLGPAGAFLGKYVVSGIFNLQNSAGFLGVAIIGAIYPLLVMTGMHMVLIAAIFQLFATAGHDSFAMPGLSVASFAVMGVCLGAFLKIKNKDQKALSIGFFFSAIVAGLSEPCLYGICMRYRRPFIGLLAGGFVGGFYAGISKATALTMVPSSNLFAVLPFAGGSTINLINGIVACFIAFFVSTLITFLFGFSKYDKEKALQS